MNPLIPTAFDVAMSVLAVAAMLFALCAFVSMVRDRKATGSTFLVWLLIVLLLPVLGALAWFCYGRAEVAARP